MTSTTNGTSKAPTKAEPATAAPKSVGTPDNKATESNGEDLLCTLCGMRACWTK